MAYRFFLSFFGHRVIEDPLRIEQRLEPLIRKHLKKKGYVEFLVGRDSVQNHLCQSCLDSINEEWFGEDPPAEIAVVSYEDKTLRPLVTCTTGFGIGNYRVNCEYREDGDIDLLIFYDPNRYASAE